jgi:hypothetical protein
MAIEYESVDGCECVPLIRYDVGAFLVHHARCAHPRHLLSEFVTVSFEPVQHVAAAYHPPSPELETGKFPGLEQFVYASSSQANPGANLVHGE